MPMEWGQNTTKQQILHGIGVGAGYVIAKAWKRGFIAPRIPDRHITQEELPAELERLRPALAKTLKQLEELRDELQKNLGENHSQIVDFHITLLGDTELYEKIQEILKTKLCCLEMAIHLAVQETCSLLENSGKTFFQERTADIRDVGTRLLNNLSGVEDIRTSFHPTEPVILVATDIPPTVAAHMSPDKVAAFITSVGSRTSHTAILAQALGIPAIVAVQESLEEIPDDACLALDIAKGSIIIQPKDELIKDYQAKANQFNNLVKELSSAQELPAETLDGYQARLVVNVALPSEAEEVKQKYNTGIGLFRTEFMFMDQQRQLTEEEQYAIYEKTVRSLKPYSVIFRTLDIGGDKLVSNNTIHENNAFMGLRGIRYSLKNPEFFKSQLRALLRTTKAGKMRIMFPMISALEELTSALQLLDDVKLSLTREGIPFSEDFDIGCMIEVPSAALLAKRLLPHVDFFSIGTNDLTQYTLAVDRANPDVAHLYQPANPAVLRQIKEVADLAYEDGKWISVCGEMAGDCLYTPLILGMGIQELSMSPHSLAPVRKVIRNMRVYEAEELVASALQCNDSEEVTHLCRDFLARACPELLLP